MFFTKYINLEMKTKSGIIDCKMHIFQTCCDVTNDGMFIVTGSTGANGNGCEVAVSSSLKVIFVVNKISDKLSKFFKISKILM